MDKDLFNTVNPPSFPQKIDSFHQNKGTQPRDSTQWKGRNIQSANGTRQLVPTNDAEALDSQATLSTRKVNKHTSVVSKLLPDTSNAILTTSLPGKNPVETRLIDGELAPDDNEQLQAKTPDSYKELLKAEILQINAALQVLKQELDLFPPTDTLTAAQQQHVNECRCLQTKLLRTAHDLKITAVLRGDEIPSKQEVKAVKRDFSKALSKDLVQLGLSESDVKTRMKHAYSDQLNQAQWKTITRDFSWGDNKYTSVQTPAAEMAATNSKNEVKSLFSTDYDGHGVSSMDNTNTHHATNLWRSEFTHNGKKIFTGIRHGINSPHGVKNHAAREEGALNKAKETVAAALATKPELFDQAVEAGKSKNAIVPTLTISSTSLVTTGLGSGKENKMQKAQREAFNKLAQHNEQPITLEMTGPDGKKVKATFILKQLQFNIPVNQGGVGRFSFILGGRMTQRNMNKKAIKQLVGNTNGNVGGIAGRRLQKLKQEIIALQKGEQTPVREAQLQALRKEYKMTLQLAQQIQQIVARGSQHHEHHDAYKLASRVVLLSSKLEETTALYNCKSGKDRTGMVDAQAKFLAACFEEFGTIPTPGERLSPQQQTLFRQILLQSGNLEIQEQNVGVRGYKTEGVHSIDEWIGDSTVRSQVRGVSHAAGS